MPFQRPSLTTLRRQASEDITTSGLPNADGFTVHFAASAPGSTFFYHITP